MMSKSKLKKLAEKDPTVRQELDAAEAIGGVRHGGSGAHALRKSDASSSRYRLEAKQTVNKSMSVGHSWLTKISREAFVSGQTPLLHVRYVNSPPDMEHDWIIMPASEFKRLKAAADE